MSAAAVTNERKPSFLRTAKAVAWSFIGLRRGADFEEDTRRLSPLHILVAGLIGGIGFVALLMLLVHWVAGV